jgi:hypothetical protein
MTAPAISTFQRTQFARKLVDEMSTSTLLRYELTLFARSFADSFSRTRDRLLLAIVAVFGLLWLRQGLADGPALPRGFELLALGAGPISFQWNRLVVRRLAWLAEESALAPVAAQYRARLRYRLAVQLPALAVVGFAAGMLGALAGRSLPAVGLAAAAYAAGGLAALVPVGEPRTRRPGRFSLKPSLSGPRTALLALIRVQAMKASRPGRALGLLIAGNAVLTSTGAFLSRESTPGAQFAAALLPSLLLLAATARNDARLAGFLAFAGFGTGYVALAVSILPAASLAAASAAVLASAPAAPASLLVPLALLHLGAALVAVARAWLSPGRNDRKVDLQVQLEAAGLVALGAILPPLGMLAFLARLWSLRSGYRASIWLQP